MDEYLTVQDMAERFGVSVPTVYLYVRQGKLKALKAGRRLAVEVASARKWWSDDPAIRHILDGNVPRPQEEVERVRALAGMAPLT